MLVRPFYGWVWVLLLLFAAVPGSVRAEAPAEALVERYGKAVVTITTTTADGQVRLGTGFFVTAEGRLITNLHVIRGASRVVVRRTDGTSFDAVEVMAHDLRQDFAILKVSASKQPTVLLGDSDLPKVGARVYVIGNPQGLENTVTDGLLSGRRMLKEGVPLLQISAPISTGSSGSPVFDTEGRVIGVAVSRVVDGQNLNFAIPINVLKGDLTRTQARTLAQLDSAVALEEAAAALNEEDLDRATELYAAAARAPHDLRTRRLAAYLALALYSARVEACTEAYKQLKRSAGPSVPTVGGLPASPDLARSQEAYRRTAEALAHRSVADLDSMTALYLECGEFIDGETLALSFRLGKAFEGEGLAVELARLQVAAAVLQDAPSTRGLREAAFSVRAGHKHHWLRKLAQAASAVEDPTEWPRLPRILQTRALFIPAGRAYTAVADAMAAQIAAGIAVSDGKAFNRLMNDRWTRIRAIHESRQKATPSPATRPFTPTGSPK